MESKKRRFTIEFLWRMGKETQLGVALQDDDDYGVVPGIWRSRREDDHGVVLVLKGLMTQFLYIIIVTLYMNPEVPLKML